MEKQSHIITNSFNDLGKETLKTCEFLGSHYLLLDENRDNDFDSITHILTTFNKKQLDILDSGCGPGIHLEYLLKKHSGKISSLTGIDFSQKMLEAAEARTKNNSMERLKLINGNLLRADFPTDSFDMILCLNNTFGNIIERGTNNGKSAREKVAKKFLKWLKPNGKLFLTVYMWRGSGKLQENLNKNKMTLVAKYSDLRRHDCVIKLNNQKLFLYFYSHFFSKAELKKYFIGRSIKKNLGVIKLIKKVNYE